MNSDMTTTTTSSPFIDETFSPKEAKAQRPELPKRNRSAFILFSLDKRKELKAQGQNASNSNQITVLVASLWKELGPEEKSKYEELAKIEKEQYNEQRKKCEEILGGKLKINRTKHNHVKKPCTCYGVFLRDNKEAIKTKYPTATMSQIMKIASKLWKNLDEDVKKKYKELANMEEQIFNAQNVGFQRVYRKRGANAKVAEPVRKDSTQESQDDVLSQDFTTKKCRSETDDYNLTISVSPAHSYYTPEEFMIPVSGTELLDTVDFGAFNLDSAEAKTKFMDPRTLSHLLNASAYFNMSQENKSLIF